MPLQRMFGFAFCGQKPMRRGKYKSNQKNQRLQNHDDGAGGPIQKETYIGSKKLVSAPMATEVAIKRENLSQSK